MSGGHVPAWTDLGVILLRIHLPIVDLQVMARWSAINTADALDDLQHHVQYLEDDTEGDSGLSGVTATHQQPSKNAKNTYKGYRRQRLNPFVNPAIVRRSASG